MNTHTHTNALTLIQSCFHLFMPATNTEQEASIDKNESKAQYSHAVIHIEIKNCLNESILIFVFSYGSFHFIHLSAFYPRNERKSAEYEYVIYFTLSFSEIVIIMEYYSVIERHICVMYFMT